MTGKPIEHYFIDWEAHVFGYGYGTGELHTIPSLKAFLAAFGDDDRPNSYNYKNLEAAVSPSVAWLLINAMCHADIIEYGTSPRFGWLTSHGEKLKEFVGSRTEDELVEMVSHTTQDYIHCYPDGCNCGEHGYVRGQKCGNPFWVER